MRACLHAVRNQQRLEGELQHETLPCSRRRRSHAPAVLRNRNRKHPHAVQVVADMAIVLAAADDFDAIRDLLRTAQLPDEAITPII